MTDIEQRLHHAGRRLREMPIDVPPLGALGIDAPPASEEPLRPCSQRAQRATAGAAAVLAAGLMMVGGLLAVSTGRANTVEPQLDVAAAPAASTAPVRAFTPPTAADRMRDPVWRIAAPANPLDEVAMLASAQLPASETDDADASTVVVSARSHVRWS